MANKVIASEITWIEPETLAGTPTIQGYQYWNALRGQRQWPTREELNPRRMTGQLGYMTLVKVIEGGTDFELRIVGDAMVRAFSLPIQHRKFSDIAHDAPELIERMELSFRKVLTTGTPVAWRQHSGRDSTHVVFTDSETVLLPLGHDSIDHVLGFGLYHTSVNRPSYGEALETTAI